MISVCIATYNGEKYIKDQLDSILAQLGEKDEIIISDDGSTDLTLMLIGSYVDNRIKIFQNPRNGVISNFENALHRAIGDYIFLSDQDDIWIDDKVQICMADFDNGYDLVLSDCVIFDSYTKQILHSSFFSFNRSGKGLLKNVIRNSYIGCCMAFKKKVKMRVIPFPNYIPMHDVWIGIIGELHFKVNFNPNKLLMYRNHSENASYTASGKSKYPFFKKLSFRFLLVYSVISNHLKF